MGSENGRFWVLKLIFYVIENLFCESFPALTILLDIFRHCFNTTLGIIRAAACHLFMQEYKYTILQIYIRCKHVIKSGKGLRLICKYLHTLKENL